MRTPLCVNCVFVCSILALNSRTEGAIGPDFIMAFKEAIATSNIVVVCDLEDALNLFEDLIGGGEATQITTVSSDNFMLKMYENVYV